MLPHLSYIYPISNYEMLTQSFSVLEFGQKRRYEVRISLSLSAALMSNHKNNGCVMSRLIFTTSQFNNYLKTQASTRRMFNKTLHIFSPYLKNCNRFQIEEFSRVVALNNMLRKKKEKEKKKQEWQNRRKQKHSWCGRYKFFLFETLFNRFFPLRLLHFKIFWFSIIFFFRKSLDFFETEISKLLNILRFSQNKHRTITVSKKNPFFIHLKEKELEGYRNYN